jgi:hypothetical protein
MNVLELERRVEQVHLLAGGLMLIQDISSSSEANQVSDMFRYAM